MILYLIKRLVQGFVVLLAVSMIVFFGVYLIGDPLTLLVPPDASQAAVDSVRQQLGLDKSIFAQYGTFLSNAANGNLGVSFVYRESAMNVILERLPATFELALSAMLIAIVIGVPLGLLAGIFPDGRLDNSLMVFSILGFSLPTFWVGILLILLFAVLLGWLPASGRGDTAEVFGIGWSILTLDGLRHIALPAFNLSLFPMSLIMRLTRSGMREAMDLDFVKFARAQGNTPSAVVMRYVLKYISIPLVTMIGIYFGVLIAFAVVTESVFSWPGMGKLIVDSVHQLDRPMIVAYMAVTVVIFVALNLIVDFFYAWLDPRVKLD